MSKLQDTIDVLVNYIIEFNSLEVELNKEQAEYIAAILIERFVSIKDANIEDAYNQMLDDQIPDNPDPIYMYALYI